MPSAFSHDPSITVPGSSTDNAIAIFDGTGGSGFGNSTILVDSGGNGRIGIAGDTDVIIVTANTVTVAGTVAATTLTGAGSGITALVAGNIASGTVPTARLGSGTANNTVFLRGDNTWATHDHASDRNNATVTGTVTTPSDITVGGATYRHHIFTGNGTFTPNQAFDIEYLVIAGGGGGGDGWRGGGGGAGGYRCSVSGESTGGGGPAELAVGVTAQQYTITVGGGGAGGAAASGTDGTDSSIIGTGFNITSDGGGGGGGNYASDADGATGGSGGGGGGHASDAGEGGTANATTQGSVGGAGLTSSTYAIGGGGGGAGGAGYDASPGTGGTNGDGGVGLSSAITGAAVTRGGGGGGGNYDSGTNTTVGGTGGGGAGGQGTGSSPAPVAGTVNTGGGGGGNSSGSTGDGAAGGSGIVIIRYSYEASGDNSFTNNVAVTGGNIIMGTAGKGIDFTASSNAAGAVNDVLKFYEEGTFIPFLADNSNTLAAQYHNGQVGRYTRIGNRCFFQLFIRTTATTGLTGSDQAYIEGLPFASVNVTYAHAAINAGAYGSLGTGNALGGDIIANSQKIRLQRVTGSAGTLQMTVNEWSTDGEAIISGHYEVA